MFETFSYAANDKYAWLGIDIFKGLPPEFGNDSLEGVTNSARRSDQASTTPEKSLFK